MSELPLSIPTSHGNGDIPSVPEENPPEQFHTQVTLISVGRFHPAGVAGCIMVYKCKGIVHAGLIPFNCFVILFFALLNCLFRICFSRQGQAIFSLIVNSFQSPSLTYFSNYSKLLDCLLLYPSLPMSAHQCFLAQWTYNVFLNRAIFYLCTVLPQKQPPGVTEFDTQCYEIFIPCLHFLFCTMRIFLHFSRLDCSIYCFPSVWRTTGVEVAIRKLSRFLSNSFSLSEQG